MATAASVLRYELEPDTGGPGKFRGGLAQTMEFQVFSPNSRITARNRDRSRFRAWDVVGGQAGTPSRFTLNPGTERMVELGAKDIVTLGPGDVIRITSSGGGGYGDPLERPAEAVLHDISRGFVGREAAQERYGVVLAGDAVDEVATRSTRSGSTRPMRN